MQTSLTEKEIESQILTYLNYLPGVFAFKINTTGVFDPKRKTFRKITNPFIVKGCSDILGVLPSGKFLAIEVKTPKGLRQSLNRPTERDLQQIAFLSKINQLGGIGFFASSIEMVEDQLKLLNRVTLNPVIE